MGGRKTRLATDFRDLLRVFVAHDVRFLVVGAYALAVLGRPRATGDLDVWIDATPENADRVIEALREFGAPLHDLRVTDLALPGVVFQIGLPPLRIDVLTVPNGSPLCDLAGAAGADRHSTFDTTSSSSTSTASASDSPSPRT